MGATLNDVQKKFTQDEYVAMRNEILKRVELQASQGLHALAALALGALGLITGAVGATTNPNGPAHAIVTQGILWFVPLFVLSKAMTWCRHHVRHREISIFVRFRELHTFDIRGWEHAARDIRPYAGPVNWFDYWGDAIPFVAYQLVLLLIAWTLHPIDLIVTQGSKWQFHPSFIFAMTCSGLTVWAAIRTWLHIRFLRKHELVEEADKFRLRRADKSEKQEPPQVSSSGEDDVLNPPSPGL
jgi:hypothetical protein